MADNLHHDDGRIAHPHHTNYGINIVVWLILLGLTILTVAVAGIDLGTFTLPVALFVAAIKSAFVISIFMHIKFDDVLFKVFLILVVATLIVVMILTSFDVFFR